MHISSIFDHPNSIQHIVYLHFRNYHSKCMNCSLKYNLYSIKYIIHLHLSAYIRETFQYIFHLYQSRLLSHMPSIIEITNPTLHNFHLLILVGIQHIYYSEAENLDSTICMFHPLHITCRYR